jgi:hypothetical protein
MIIALGQNATGYGECGVIAGQRYYVKASAAVGTPRSAVESMGLARLGSLR